MKGVPRAFSTSSVVDKAFPFLRIRLNLGHFLTMKSTKKTYSFRTEKEKPQTNKSSGMVTASPSWYLQYLLLSEHCGRDQFPPFASASSED